MTQRISKGVCLSRAPKWFGKKAVTSGLHPEGRNSEAIYVYCYGPESRGGEGMGIMARRESSNI